jgi:hypothetical protein
MLWTNTIILMMWALTANPLYSNTPGRSTRTPDQEQLVVLARGPVQQTFIEEINLPGQTDPAAPNQPPVQIKEIPSAQRPEVPHLPGFWATGSGVEISIAPRFWNKRRHAWPNPFYKHDGLENGPTKLPEPPQGDFQPRSFINEALPAKTGRQVGVQGLCAGPDMARVTCQTGE